MREKYLPTYFMRVFFSQAFPVNHCTLAIPDFYTFLKKFYILAFQLL